MAANGPDMDEKLSRLNARARAKAHGRFSLLRESFKGPAANRRDTRALLLSVISRTLSLCCPLFVPYPGPFFRLSEFVP